MFDKQPLTKAVTGMTPAGVPSTDRDSFVRAMRQIASKVAVITPNDIAPCHCATVTAFSPVWMDPLMVLGCLRSESQIAKTVTTDGALRVNAMPHDQPGLANRFAKNEYHLLDDRFLALGVTGAAGSAPKIDGATAFASVVDHSVAAGSHSISICWVQIDCQGPAATWTCFDARYHDVVPHVTKHQNTATA